LPTSPPVQPNPADPDTSLSPQSRGTAALAAREIRQFRTRAEPAPGHLGLLRPTSSPRLVRRPPPRRSLP